MHHFTHAGFLSKTLVHAHVDDNCVISFLWTKALSDSKIMNLNDQKNSFFFMLSVCTWTLAVLVFKYL